MENTEQSASAIFAELAHKHWQNAEKLSKVFLEHPPHPELRACVLVQINDYRNDARRCGDQAMQIGNWLS